MRDGKFYITEYIYDVVSRYMAMPAISLDTVTNGPELMAGSTFILRKRIGAVDPMTAETLTASTIPKPTADPKSGDV